MVPGIGLKFMVTPRLGIAGGLRYYMLDSGIQSSAGLKPRFFNSSLALDYRL